jgi:hypothetical protein
MTLPCDVISRKLSVLNAERIFFIRHALRAGFTSERIFSLTKIDRSEAPTRKMVLSAAKICCDDCLLVSNCEHFISHF